MLSLLLLVLLASPLALAQSSQTIVNPTTAGPSATAPTSPGHGYVYAGCFNETTSVPGTNDARALSGGNVSVNNTMTVGACVAFCASARPDNAFAGLEYGRECYCAPYLSPFSTPLDPSRCEFACDGNASEICGGRLALSLYNRTGNAAQKGVAGRLMGGWGGDGGLWGFAGLVMVVVAAVL